MADLVSVTVTGARQVAAELESDRKRWRRVMSAKMRDVVRDTRNVLRRRITQQFRSRRRRLRGEIVGKTEVDRSGDVIGRVGIKKRFYYIIYETGGVIRPRSARVLVFPVGDAWATARFVRIPRRPFLAPTAAEQREPAARKLGDSYDVFVQ